MSKLIRKSVSDLGVAAFIRMNAFKCIGKRGRNFIFEISEEEERNFLNTLILYESSICSQFDSCLMSLKRLPPDHIAEEEI